MSTVEAADISALASARTGTAGGTMGPDMGGRARIIYQWGAMTWPRKLNRAAARDRGAPRVSRGAPSVGGVGGDDGAQVQSWRGARSRSAPGVPGRSERWGGLGGHLGAPQVQSCKGSVTSSATTSAP